ncbi:MAG: hypothetical protein ABI743_04720 [bacterium]
MVRIPDQRFAHGLYWELHPNVAYSNDPVTLTAGELASLTELNNASFLYADSLEGLEYCVNVERIAPAWIDKGNPQSGITDLSPIIALTKLRELSLGRAPRLTDLSPLANLHQLKTLALYQLPLVTNLSPVGKLTSLTSLSIDRLTAVRSLAPLANLSHLESLSLGSMDRVTSLHELNGSLAPTTIEIVGLPALDSLQGLPIGALEVVDLRDLPQLHSLDGLQGATKLTTVSISGKDTSLDLSALASCPKLRRLDVDGLRIPAVPQFDHWVIMIQLTGVTIDDLSGLLNNPGIGQSTHLYLRQCTYDKDAMAPIREELLNRGVVLLLN